MTDVAEIARDIDALEWLSCDGRINPALIAVLEGFSAQAALTAMLEGFGGDGVTEADRQAARHWLRAMLPKGQSMPDALANHFARHRSTAAAAERARMGWQPIETAPTDGTPLLLFARCKTATAPVALVGWHLPDMGWIEASFTSPVGVVPTHWMPLPAPPTDAIERGEI